MPKPDSSDKHPLPELSSVTAAMRAAIATLQDHLALHGSKSGERAYRDLGDALKKCESLEKSLQALALAHDDLSEKLESEDAENDDVRDAAIAACAAMEGVWVTINQSSSPHPRAPATRGSAQDSPHVTVDFDESGLLTHVYVDPLGRGATIEQAAANAALFSHAADMRGFLDVVIAGNTEFEGLERMAGELADRIDAHGANYAAELKRDFSESATPEPNAAELPSANPTTQAARKK